MSKVTLLISVELLEQLLDLGDRDILGIVETRDPLTLALLIGDPDAPAAATTMEPAYELGSDGRAKMLRPGYR